jgi:hypothetical protein
MLQSRARRRTGDRHGRCFTSWWAATADCRSCHRQTGRGIGPGPPPPPQSRPARTLVLIFMVSPLRDDVRPAAIATGTDVGRRLLVGCYGVSITMGPPPQSRPARTLVLIFIVAPLKSDGDDVRPAALATGTDVSGRGRKLAASATGANLGLDLHGGLLDPDRAAVATGANLGLDLHVSSYLPSGRVSQSRPARTLVLIFIGGLLSIYPQSQASEPHSRPARTLVLIFMLGS